MVRRRSYARRPGPTVRSICSPMTMTRRSAWLTLLDCSVAIAPACTRCSARATSSLRRLPTMSTIARVPSASCARAWSAGWWPGAAGPAARAAQRLGADRPRRRRPGVAGALPRAARAVGRAMAQCGVAVDRKGCALYAIVYAVTDALGDQPVSELFRCRVFDDLLQRHRVSFGPGSFERAFAEPGTDHSSVGFEELAPLHVLARAICFSQCGDRAKQTG